MNTIFRLLYLFLLCSTVSVHAHTPTLEGKCWISELRNDLIASQNILLKLKDSNAQALPNNSFGMRIAKEMGYVVASAGITTLVVSLSAWSFQNRSFLDNLKNMPRYALPPALCYAATKLVSKKTHILKEIIHMIVALFGSKLFMEMTPDAFKMAVMPTILVYACLKLIIDRPSRLEENQIQIEQSLEVIDKALTLLNQQLTSNAVTP